MKRIVSVLITLALLLSLAGCGSAEDKQADPAGNNTPAVYEQYPNAGVLKLNGSSAELNGTTLKEYDYTWAFDPSMSEPFSFG